MADPTPTTKPSTIAIALTLTAAALGGIQISPALSALPSWATTLVNVAILVLGALGTQLHVMAHKPSGGPPPQSGRVRLDALGILATLAGGFAITVVMIHLLTGCATLKTMTGAFATCAKQDLGQLVKTEAGQLVPLATDVAQLIDGNAVSLESALETLATTVGLDAIDCAVVAYDATHTPFAGSGSAVTVSLFLAPGLVRAKAWVAAQRSKK